jgi:hypothetical protein
MRKTIGFAAIAVWGLTFALGSGPEEETTAVTLVYSSDERGELHPCG